MKSPVGVGKAHCFSESKNNLVFADNKWLDEVVF